MSVAAPGRGYTAASRPSGILKTVLKNGIGRPVVQLKRITLKFCENHSRSRLARVFVENHLVDFARRHPTVVVYTMPEIDAMPTVCAEFLNGREEYHDLDKQEPDAILKTLETLTGRSGMELIRIINDWHTYTPSIQGQWHPFTNKKDYEIGKPLDFKVKLWDSWTPLEDPWGKRYRKDEIEKLSNRPKLNHKEKSEQPMGKWGPILPPLY